MIVNILGTDYTIEKHKRSDDDKLYDCGGYMERYSKRIIVEDVGEESVLTCEDVKQVEIENIRHEIMHAFFYESGLFADSVFGHNEELMGWIAIQLPKIVDVMRQAECLQ